MSAVEAAFDNLMQETAELKEELRLTHERLRIRNESLILLVERAGVQYKDILEEAECMESFHGDIGER